MRFELEQAVEVLGSTPKVLRGMIGDLSVEWTAEFASEARPKWEAFDVVGHLIHGEKTDWIPRARIILAQGGDRTFEPFDRFAQFEDSRGKTLADLLEEFEHLRAQSVATLISWELVEEELELIGVHPEFGEVTLRQLLATWVVHDLNHIGQIAAAMAGKYREEVGPWQAYLSILHTKGPD